MFPITERSRPEDPSFEDTLPDLQDEQFNRVLSAAHELWALIGDSGDQYSLREGIELVFREAALRGIEDDSGLDYREYDPDDPMWDDPIQ